LVFLRFLVFKKNFEKILENLKNFEEKNCSIYRSIKKIGKNMLLRTKGGLL
jgi:hypothetical protein